MHINQLDKITLRLQNEITAIAFKCYKQRQTLDITALSWWTTEIKIARNRVRAYKRTYQKQQDKELKHKQHVEYKKDRAKLKRLVHKTKCSTWKKYCDEAMNTYEPWYKVAANKTTKPMRLVNILPNNHPVTMTNILNYFLNNLYLTNPKTAHKLMLASPSFNDISPPVISKPELNKIIRHIKQLLAIHHIIDQPWASTITLALPLKKSKSLSHLLWQVEKGFMQKIIATHKRIVNNP